MDQIIKVYKDFQPELLALIRKVDPATVKVWQLMDMETLPAWTVGRLALLGDAAHPFTPRELASQKGMRTVHSLTSFQTKDRGLVKPSKTLLRSPSCYPKEHHPMLFPKG